MGRTKAISALQLRRPRNSTLAPAPGKDDGYDDVISSERSRELIERLKLDRVQLYAKIHKAAAACFKAFKVLAHCVLVGVRW